MGPEGRDLYAERRLSFHASTMASNQVSNSCSTHGYSKSQMCFFKILRVISSIPPSPQQQPHPTPEHDSSNSSPSSRGIDVDLNIRFRSVSENAEFQCSASNSSAIEETKGGDKRIEASRVTDTEETKFEEQIGEDREGKELNEDCETVRFGGKRQASYNNCLDLLIEAAKLVFEERSGERGLGSELRTRRSEGKHSKQRWMVVDLCSEMNDRSPVVRSKRGRSQALPFRFRDSVVEPLKRSGCRPQRPSTATTRASRKRLVGS